MLIDRFWSKAFRKQPFSLPWLFSILKKPDLFLFQNTKITSDSFELLKKQRLERYRSIWATCSVDEQMGGVCTYSKKAFPMALDTVDSSQVERKHYPCSHNYVPIIPYSNHPLFNITG